MRTHASNFQLKVAAFLLAAPLVSNAQILSSCYPVANTSQPEFAVSSASDGTNFLVGIQGHTRGPKVAGAQLISPDGIRIGGFITTGRTMDGFFDAPRVAFGGSHYVIVWTDADSQHPATGNDVYSCLISPAGKMVGTPFPVSQASGDQAARGVAFDGSHFLVIWSAENGLRGRRLAANGDPLPNEWVFTVEEVEEAAAVASGGGQFLVAWVEGTDGAHVAKGRMISAAGALGDVVFLSQNNSHFYNPISVAYGKDRFMAVWHHKANENADWNLRGRMIRPDGTLPGGEFPVTTGPIDDLAWANNVAFDGEHFVVVWTQSESPLAKDGVVWAQYWTDNGVNLGPPIALDNSARSKLGLGLSGGAGRWWTIINTDLTQSSADVCGRLIARPTVALTRSGPTSIRISYTGVLQYSTHLTAWVDFSPQPPNPWITTTIENAMLFRSR